MYYCELWLYTSKVVLFFLMWDTSFVLFLFTIFYFLWRYLELTEEDKEKLKGSYKVKQIYFFSNYTINLILFCHLKSWLRVCFFPCCGANIVFPVVYVFFSPCYAIFTIFEKYTSLTCNYFKNVLVLLIKISWKKWRYSGQIL